MTDNNNDKLKGLLESSRMEAPENEWFTRKVMNRLPEQKPRGHNWILWIIYGAVLSVCLICWVAFGLNTDFSTFFRQFAEIKTGNIPAAVSVYFVLLSTIGVVVWQIISTALHSDRR